MDIKEQELSPRAKRAEAVEKALGKWRHDPKAKPYTAGWQGKSRQRHKGARQPLLANWGLYTTELCPKCGGGIMSNGNLFCEFWLGDADTKVWDECDWALPHPQTKYADKLISWKIVGYWESESRDGERWFTHETEPKRPAPRTRKKVEPAKELEELE